MIIYCRQQVWYTNLPDVGYNVVIYNLLAKIFHISYGADAAEEADHQTFVAERFL